MKKILVIGGGTGTFVVLSSLTHDPELDLDAIVTVTDSGGSTGKLRDQYGYLPVGDLRQCLVALSNLNGYNKILRYLMVHRFEKGDLQGHNFGNLFLIALTDILGSEEKAIQFASRLFQVKGHIIPISKGNVDLVAHYEDGTTLVGEKYIDEPDIEKHDLSKRIIDLKIQPTTKINPDAQKAILEADIIITGPGDLYSSICSNFVVPGAKAAMVKTKAKFIYILNIMTKYGQTTNYTASEHVEELIKYSGKVPDFVIVNNRKIPKATEKKYQEEMAIQVIDDLTKLKKKYDFKIIREDLISKVQTRRLKQDRVKRSLLRHDSTKIAKIVKQIVAGKM
ncbi:YvcK family protein [Candidatus Dojkabacteria bacterium]|nr:YvcK family protein [Candidatus Dojkabacteria bacterium]